MLAKLKEFIIVCVHSKTPLTGLDLRRLQERIVASKPQYWEETEPGVFLVFFLIRRGGRTRSLKLAAGLRILRRPESPYDSLGIAKTVGELVTESNWYGKILTCPFGDAVNQALKKAREDSGKDGATRETENEEVNG
jgi:hypothetical protein